MCSKHPARTPAEARTQTHIEVACLFFFVAEVLVKICAYGDARLYLSLRINVCDAVLSSVAFLGFLVQGVDTEEQQHQLSVVHVCGVIRIVSLLRYWPHVYLLLLDNLKGLWQLSSALAVVLSVWLAYALFGLQVFAGTELPPAAFPGGEQHYEAMGKFAYFDSVAGALCAVLRLMTGVNMSTSMVQGFQASSERALIAFILVGGIVLELVIMKTFLAVLIDNFETDDRDKIMHQMYQADKKARKESEDKRYHAAVHNATRLSEFAFSDFHFTRALMPQTYDVAAPSNSSLVLQGWGFWCGHSGEVPGKRVWMELPDNGILACWGVRWVGKEYVRTGVQVTIPMLHAHVFEQSSARVRIVPQAGPFSFVVRACCTDPATVGMAYIHMEQVLFVPSAAALKKWLTSLAAFGARVQSSLLIHTETKPKPFGWDALVKTLPGFGFNSDEDEEMVPGPKALVDAFRGAPSAPAGPALLIRCGGMHARAHTCAYTHTHTHTHTRTTASASRNFPTPRRSAGSRTGSRNTPNYVISLSTPTTTCAPPPGCPWGSCSRP